MAEKLSWDEILKRYNQEWVELVDYDWPDEEPDPKSGIVRVHAKTRAEFDRLTDVDPPQDSAYVFVGKPKRSEYTTRGYRYIEIVPNNA